jgi:hypothetical protein
MLGCTNARYNLTDIGCFSYFLFLLRKLVGWKYKFDGDTDRF